MELHHLRHVLAVATTGHFGRAAQQLGIAQPALSQSLQRLERHLGVRLFERGRQGATPTPAGEAFIAEAQAALAAAQRAVALAQSAAAPSSPVRIGFTSTVLWSALPRIVAAADGIAFRFHHMTTDDQLAALVAGRIDLGLVSPPFKVPTRMTVYNLPSEPLVAALPATRRAAGRVSLTDLASALILFPATQGPALHASIIAAFHARGIAPRIVQEATEMATILALVAAGIGNAIVPRAAARRLPVTGVTFRLIGRGARLPSWPLALAHMPLPATSPAAALVLRWRRNVDGRR